MNLDHVTITGPVDNLAVYEDVHVGEGSLINCHAPVVLREHVMAGHRVMILAGGHDYRLFSEERIGSAPPKPPTIYIETGVWIGSGAIVVGPCIIGEHSVVAAGAVVQGVFPPYSMIIGNPGRVYWRIKHDA